MDSSNLQGVYLQWLRPKTEIDFNNVLSTDWQFIKTLQCPVIDGSAFDLGENYEWLANEQGVQPIYYDSRLLVLIEDARPSKTHHSLFPNYKRFYRADALEQRSIPEISESIIQEEKMANTALDQEADVAVMTTFVLGYLAAIASGLVPTEAQVNAYNRQAYVQQKKSQNAANRIELIRQLNLGNYNVDISLGWERDNITVGGFPFSN